MPAYATMGEFVRCIRAMSFAQAGQKGRFGRVLAGEGSRVARINRATANAGVGNHWLRFGAEARGERGSRREESQ